MAASESRADRPVAIVPIGSVGQDPLHRVVRHVERSLGIPASVDRPFAPRPEWGRGEADGWRSDVVLDSLVEWAVCNSEEERARIVIAITETRLLAPGRPDPFGQATIGGCCAVVTLAPLGDPAHPLRIQRLVKEVTHELGHICGLGHCRDPLCVMYPSAGLDATDRKSQAFCGRCTSQAAACFPGLRRSASP